MSVIAQAGAKGRQLHKFGGSSLADVKEMCIRDRGITDVTPLPVRSD